MIKNNKGFMLIEVIVTSTIVVTAMISLYASFNKLYNNYRIKNSYYNIDAVYATKEMINSMIKMGNMNTFVNETIINDNYGYIIKYDTNSTTCNENKISQSCNKIREFYQITNMILVEYDLESINKLKNTESRLNQTFFDYIDYVKNYYNIKKEDYNYIVLTEIKNGDNYYYSNLRMR